MMLVGAVFFIVDSMGILHLQGPSFGQTVVVNVCRGKGKFGP
jgi:hypothetical protein